MAVEADDFRMVSEKPIDGTPQGFKVIYEISAGGILVARPADQDFFVMKSKDGNKGTFYFSKGKLKIVDGGKRIESPMEAALRETRQELFLPDSAKLTVIPCNRDFSYHENTLFKRSQEHSIKVVSLYLLGIENYPYATHHKLNDGKVVSLLTPKEAREFAMPALLPIFDSLDDYVGAFNQ